MKKYDRKEAKQVDNILAIPNKKKTVRKEWIIESRPTEEAWERWGKGNGFNLLILMCKRGAGWQTWKKYSSQKARDQGLEHVMKKRTCERAWERNFEYRVGTF